MQLRAGLEPLSVVGIFLLGGVAVFTTKKWCVDYYEKEGKWWRSSAH